MNRKGFTLVELLMVVIIIGILATIAVPNYYKAVERAKAAKAKASLDLMRKAEISYRALNDTFTDNSGDELDSVDFSTAAVIGVSTDWTYTFGNVAATTVDVVATRQTGQYANESITIDQDGIITYSDPTILEWQ
ncbi:MAG: hypothetical protein DRP78_06895 [Candidatus Omnitrophota bacterium]|nr:MAG: hypothetical protein DRP78_06895 [Candidatus Omnitrophota bacterium]